ncbi:hypothetical protein QBC45DRAFT_397759 [Copromyces sp. CBS 386.78]|nr:hypothetical protein QBC45DRAFT_397759 [Copromyces sp. CBS 386.78]
MRRPSSSTSALTSVTTKRPWASWRKMFPGSSTVEPMPAAPTIGEQEIPHASLQATNPAVYQSANDNQSVGQVIMSDNQSPGAPPPTSTLETRVPSQYHTSSPISVAESEPAVANNHPPVSHVEAHSHPAAISNTQVESSALTAGPPRLTAEALALIDQAFPPTLQQLGAQAPSLATLAASDAADAQLAPIVPGPPIIIAHTEENICLRGKKKWIGSLHRDGFYLCTDRYDAAVSTANTFCNKCKARNAKENKAWDDYFAPVLAWLEDVENEEQEWVGILGNSEEDLESEEDTESEDEMDDDLSDEDMDSEDEMDDDLSDEDMDSEDEVDVDLSEEDTESEDDMDVELESAGDEDED